MVAVAMVAVAMVAVAKVTEAMVTVAASRKGREAWQALEVKRRGSRRVRRYRRLTIR